MKTLKALSIICLKRISCRSSKVIKTKDFILKIRFLIIALLMILCIKFSIRFFSLNSVITKVKNKSALYLLKNKPKESINRINFWYGRLNKFLKIRSCFVNSLAKKLIFSSFGHDLIIVCGVKLDNASKIEGHAWLSYKTNVVFEDEKNLKDYTESFRV